MKIIIGSALNYSWSELYPFVVSCTKYSRVGLLVGDNTTDSTMETLEEFPQVWLIPCSLRTNHVQMSPYLDAGRSLSRWNNKAMKLVCSRFAAIYAFLHFHRKEFDTVLLTDTRDVIATGDIFSYPWTKGKVHLFEEHEDMTIGKCPYNSVAISKAYGSNVLEEMKDRRIICSGSILGHIDDILVFLEMMLDEYMKVDTMTGGITDQAVTNFLAHTRPELFEQHENRTSPLLNVGYMQTGATMEGRLMCHQYDRSAHTSLAAGLLGGL